MTNDFRDADAANAIRGIILAQIDAFLRDDDDLAFSYASPAIQEMFETPGTFMDMVRRHYIPVHRPTGLEFERLDRASARRMFQEVRLTDLVHGSVVARYEMWLGDDGIWCVNGCVLSSE